MKDTVGRVETVAGTQLPICKCNSNGGTTGGGPRVGRAAKFSSKVRSPDFMQTLSLKCGVRSREGQSGEVLKHSDPAISHAA